MCRSFGGEDDMIRDYGTLELTQSSPEQEPAEPMVLAELRHYLKLDTPSPADAEEDALLESYITAAREVAEIMQNRDLVEKQWDLRLDSFPAEEAELRGPLTAVDLVQYKDSDGSEFALAESTDYIVDLPRALVMPAYGQTWPSFTAWPSSAVLIRFRSGYSSGHQFWKGRGRMVKAGMKMLIAMWYEERLPFKEAIEVKELPYAVTALLGFGAANNIR
jgi:uncharacterized phiE125 gp8 family phage protein